MEKLLLTIKCIMWSLSLSEKLFPCVQALCTVPIKHWFAIEENNANEKNPCIYVIGADITLMRADAIVNSANCSLLGGGGVDGAIHRVAGRELRQECEQLGRIQYGEARLTKGYRLFSPYVIHTAGPHYYGEPEEPDWLRSCYLNSLFLAQRNGCHSLAIPGISTGIYRYPQKEAAHIALSTVIGWLQENRDWAMTVVFCCYEAAMFEAYENCVQEINSRETLNFHGYV